MDLSSGILLLLSKTESLIEEFLSAVNQVPYIIKVKSKPTSKIMLTFYLLENYKTLEKITTSNETTDNTMVIVCVLAMFVCATFALVGCIYITSFCFR